MHVPAHEPVFENRYDAGRKLAEKLTEYSQRSPIIKAIPNGGVAVALGVALALDAELDLVISRKVPLPLSPEGGFGAVTDDGTIILNDDVVQSHGLTEQQINYQVNRVRSDIRQRSLLYLGKRAPAIISDRTVIIIDDGLASGYTMMAAVESVRQRRPREIVVAVPVAPADAVKRVRKVADRVVTYVTGTAPKFYIADFYRYWHETTDDEVIHCLREWRMRRYQSKIEPTESK